MTNPHYRCWSPAYNGDEDEPEIISSVASRDTAWAMDSEDAARTYAEGIFEGSDPFREIVVCVQAVNEDGVVDETEIFIVYVDYSPDFHAAPADDDTLKQHNVKREDC